MASKNAPAAHQKHLAVLIDAASLILLLMFDCPRSTHANN